MSTPNDESVWSIGDRVAWTESDDRAVVLVIGSPNSRPIALEGSARVIWRLIALHGPLADCELVRMTAAEFAVSAHDVHSDVQALLRALHSHRALDRVLVSEADDRDGR